MRPTQIIRSEDLMNLSPCGQMGPTEEVALKYRDRARSVYGGSSKRLTKIPYLVHLELASAIPSWIGELTHLRTLVCRGATARLPAGLANLPHLSSLHVDSCGLTSLDGLDKLPALTTITFAGTPIARDQAAIAAMIAKIPGAKPLAFLPGIEIARKPPPAPKDRKKLLKALRDDTLPDHSELQGVNLEGETFEDLWITHSFANAKLAHTVWKRCDFDGSLAGADLTGAVFEDCYFSASYHGGNLTKARARGAQWIWCGGTLQLSDGDVRDAELYLESDTGLEIVRANAANAAIVCSFCSEREHRWEARDADLTGARIDLDVTPDRRAEIQQKKTSRFRWKQDHVKGAKLDKQTTRLTYAPLDGAPLGDDPIDRKGPAATVLGSLWAINAGLWALIADADVAASWRGSVDEADPKDDFQRALATEDAPIKIGGGKGFIAQIGDSGGSPIWQIPGGIMLADFTVDRKHAKDVNLRVAQWPAPKKKTKLGTLKVTSGALAILLPYEDGVFTPAQRRKAKTSPVRATASKLLVPVPNGEYVISTAPLGPTDNYEDELGWYGQALRIERRAPT